MKQINTHMHVIATMTLTALKCQDCDFGGKTDEWMGFVAAHLGEQPLHTVLAVTNATSFATFRAIDDEDFASSSDGAAQGKGEG